MNKQVRRFSIGLGFVGTLAFLMFCAVGPIILSIVRQSDYWLLLYVPIVLTAIWGIGTLFEDCV